LIYGKYAQFRLPQSPVVKNGRRMIGDFACRRCHRIGGNGNGLAANLDSILPDVQPQELTDAIKVPAASMPDFYFTEAQITKLVNAVLYHASGVESELAEVPLVVHFENNNENLENIFSESCSDCHRVLTRKFGGLGRGDIGPNLSGLMTEFYPQNYEIEESWTASVLKKWLRNPREIRVNARMNTVQLSDDEFADLVSLFQN
jgi:cytochrome c2